MANLAEDTIIDKTFFESRVIILKVILLLVVFLAFVAVLVNIFSAERYDPVDSFLPCIFLIFSWILYVLSVKGFLKLPTFFIVGFLSLISYYLSWQYGTMLPQVWILVALTIAIGGILIGSKFSIFLLIIHEIVLFSLTYFQSRGLIKYEFWDETPMIGSILVAIFTFGIMTIISCLSNREIEKALRRAKKSELELKKERDNLEIEVEKRTEELKKVQLEKMANLYRFADFGRLTAGLFHDIANPLTQVSLSLSKIQYQAKNKFSTELKEIDPVVKRAINGTRQMEKLMVSVKKQIQQQETSGLYNPWGEIEMVKENLEYKAKKLDVQVSMIGNKEISTYGNALKFYQVVSNLVSNALDSYYEVKRKENRKIIIGLDIENNDVMFTVKDFGCGIDDQIKEKIFDSWFTTKDNKKGSGIGLYISKNIVEKEFGGKIEMKSKIGKGSLFTVKFPIKNNSDGK